MPRVYAFQADDETTALIEHDRTTLAQAMGLDEPLTPSQYLRLLVADRVQAHRIGGVPERGKGYKFAGYAEGVKLGYAEVMRRLKGALGDLSQIPDDI